jgi:polysaccharide export outer membrane protein
MRSILSIVLPVIFSAIGLQACDLAHGEQTASGSGPSFVERIFQQDTWASGDAEVSGPPESTSAAALREKLGTIGGQKVFPIPEPSGVRVLGAGPPDYRIGVGDVLEVTVFGVDELGKTVRVTPRGEIGLPLIGKILTVGKTSAEVEAEVAEKLVATYLQAPQVSVFVKESVTAPITVSGAVKSPGSYPTAGQTTLLRAIALGGGIDELANRSNVLVFRTVDGRPSAARFDASSIGRGEAADPIILAGDVIIVDYSETRVWLRDITKGLPLVSTFLPLILLF